MNLIKTTPHQIYVAEFETQYLVASTFLRLQEFYESPIPGFKGTYFTREQYEDAYAAEYGNFTYTQDWSGFNIPGNVVRRFFALFRDLNNKEMYLYTKLLPILERPDKFYLLGTICDDADTLDHEIAHGYWHLVPSYQLAMREVIDNFAKRSKITSWLKRKGYDVSTFDDEIQAYCSTSSKSELARMELTTADVKEFKAVRKRFM